MPSLSRLLKPSRLNLQVLLAFLGIYTLVFNFTNRVGQSSFYSFTFMDVFNEKVSLDQKDSNLIHYIQNEMLAHPKPYQRVNN